MSESTVEQGGTPKAGDAPKTFTQEEVNRLVGETRRTVTANVESKYSDYADLKAKAEGAQSTEERLAAFEAKDRARDAEAARVALAAKVAKTHKITDAEDIALFLTGSDEETLTAQAERLATRTAQPEPKKKNYVPAEGQQANGSSSGGELEAFTRTLFNKE